LDLGRSVIVRKEVSSVNPFCGKVIIYFLPIQQYIQHTAIMTAFRTLFATLFLLGSATAFAPVNRPSMAVSKTALEFGFLKELGLEKPDWLPDFGGKKEEEAAAAPEDAEAPADGEAGEEEEAAAEE
jgi:hypothetical protein